MIRPLLQQHQDITRHELGDCFATCVAMVLDLPQPDVPNFCAVGDAWWEGFLLWCEGQGITAMEVKLQPGALSRLTAGIPCILSGLSPRGTWQHSVVGVTTEGGFAYLHDPHPDATFLAGEPQHVLFFMMLRPDRNWVLNLK